MGFPVCHTGKETACQCRRHKRPRFNPWVGKIPWRRTWHHIWLFFSFSSQFTYSPEYNIYPLYGFSHNFNLHVFLLFGHYVVSDSLWPHGLQHARLPCPLPTPRVCSNSCPLSRCCHWTNSSSADLFSYCFNLEQHQGLFQVFLILQIRWSKYWVFSFSISPSNEYSGFIYFRVD